MHRFILSILALVLVLSFTGANFFAWHQYQQVQGRLDTKKQMWTLLQRQTQIWVEQGADVYIQRASNASSEDIMAWLENWATTHPQTSVQVVADTADNIEIQLQTNKMQELLQFGADVHHQLPMYLVSLQVEPQIDTLSINLGYDVDVPK